MDLSYAAAYKLDIINSGSAEVEVESILPGQAEPPGQPIIAEPVKVEPLKPESAPPAIIPIAATPILPPAAQDSAIAAQENRDAAGSVFLQLGSFHSVQGAQSFMAEMRRKLGDLDKQIRMLTQGGMTRVRLGPYRSAEEARLSADQLESRLGFKPFVSAR
jgi:rare lipoprotein A